jgi:hypothetical protein
VEALHPAVSAKVDLLGRLFDVVAAPLVTLFGIMETVNRLLPPGAV